MGAMMVLLCVNSSLQPRHEELLMATPYVELRSVSNSRVRHRAKDVSFDVCPGEVHCLLGDNGAASRR